MRRTRQESERMSRLVVDMLRLAKLDLNPELQATRVDLCELARDAVADATATQKGRTVAADLPEHPVFTWGDADLLRQVFSNLLQNALHHSTANAPIQVIIMTRGDRAVVQVVDRGTGMTAEVVARATERFYRADRARSRDNGGAGLGLAIVESVIAAHDGSLSIDSKLGVGTTVEFDLPISTLDSQGIHS